MILTLGDIDVSTHHILRIEKGEERRPRTAEETAKDPSGYGAARNRETVPTINVLMGHGVGTGRHIMYFTDETSRDYALAQLRKRIAGNDPVINISGSLFRLSQITSVLFSATGHRGAIRIKVKGQREAELTMNADEYLHYKELLPQLLGAKTIYELSATK
jgi:hypothetical protein